MFSKRSEESPAAQNAASSSPELFPVESEDQIDYNSLYALQAFAAVMEGQATVEAGEVLQLLDDTNSYWWYVRVLRTGQMGYLPAENIEVCGHHANCHAHTKPIFF